MSNPATIVSSTLSSLTNPITAVNFFPTVIGGSTRLTLSAGVSGSTNAALSNPIEDGKWFLIKVVQKITGGTTTNYTPSLYFWNNANTDLTTATCDVVILTSTAFAVNSVTQYWAVQAYGFWDSVNAKISGWITGMTSSAGAQAFITPVAWTNVGIASASVNRVQFCTGGFFSVSNGANLVTLVEFSIDKL